MFHDDVDTLLKVAAEIETKAADADQALVADGIALLQAFNGIKDASVRGALLVLVTRTFWAMRDEDARKRIASSATLEGAD